jgi:hypothetical protein
LAYAIHEMGYVEGMSTVGKNRRSVYTPNVEMQSELRRKELGISGGSPQSCSHAQYLEA